MLGDPPLAALVALLLLSAAALLAQPWWVRRRRAKLLRGPFPPAWRRILQRRVPLAARLPAPLQARLQQLVRIFIAEKPFIGCNGQVIDDEVRVSIAAHACLLLLGDGADGVYPRLRQVLVYPEPFVVPRRQWLPGGVLQEQPQALSGESWGQGQVLLAWSELQAHDGRNVVLHEFAHQIDQDGGEADGRPWRADPAAAQRFADVMGAAFERLQHEASSALDPYGASAPAEYFAVATEAFFERPQALAAEAPQVYDELARLYRLDPAAWHDAGAAGAATPA
ncbi:MAG: zinc-dependent peptidase [Rubrivivax sp.]|nr:zinc-dependent peptidase [Rubrivivax sp.]